ncbi:MAG: hypothetical protein LBP51_07060 [Deferribacteraceae bacterium]|jgi:hypothetical protein|nr:hypothetical protein [Deferribacteraceae bacterium]
MKFFKILFVSLFSLFGILACTEDDGGSTNYYSTPAPAQSSIPFNRGVDNGYVITSNQGNRTLGVLNSFTGRLVGTIDLSAEISTSATKKGQSHFLVVTRNGAEIWLGEESGEAGNVIVYDLKGNGGGKAAVFTDNPDTRRVTVDLTDADSSEKLLKRFSGVGSSINFYLSHDGRYAFNSNGRKGAHNANGPVGINVYDVIKKVHLGVIRNGETIDNPANEASPINTGDPHVIESTQDDKVLWVTDAAGGNIIAFDISKLDLVERVDDLTITKERVLNDLQDAEGKVAQIVKFPIRAPGLLHNAIPSLHAFAVHPSGNFVLVGAAGGNQNSDRTAETDYEGNYVIDVRDIKNPKFFAKVPGNPHNYELSPDLKYLLSTESYGVDCEEAHHVPDDESSYLVRIDISTLSSSAPKASEIVIDKYVASKDTLGFGSGSNTTVSHVLYSPDGELVYVTYYNDKLVIFDAQGLFPISVVDLGSGAKAHSLAIPGYAR